MNDDQLLRYSRHILLDEVGIEGQQALLDAHVLIIGAGGLGDLAIRYGYERYETRVMFEVIVILVALVSIVQFAGEFLSRRVNHRH